MPSSLLGERDDDKRCIPRRISSHSGRKKTLREAWVSFRRSVRNLGTHVRQNARWPRLLSGKPARILRTFESEAELANVLKCELAAEVLLSYGRLRFAATGWSMIPTIWPGDTLLVERASRQQMRVGDVVLLLRKGRLCAHRLVSQKNDDGGLSWHTQGDAMSMPDPDGSDDELSGRVTHLVRAGRRIAVSSKLSVGQRLVGRIVARSYAAARVIVYLYGWVRTPDKAHAPDNSVVSCQS